MDIPASMRAVVYRGKDTLRLESVPIPRIRHDEILVRVGVCGVCPTDIKKIKHATVEPPRIFGHETAGIIARVGRNVSQFSAGQRVALHHHVPCMKCHACRHRAFAQCPVYKKTGITAGFEPAGGGYAEFVRVMPFVFPGIVPIPRKNELLEGAMLEPVNTVLKAVERLDLIKGDVVLVVGLGPIGLMFTRLLQLAGTIVIGTDLSSNRLALAKTFGAAWSFHPDDAGLKKRIDLSTRRRGLDAVVVAAPSDESVVQGMRFIRGGGKVLLFAHTRRGQDITIDPASVCVDEKDLIGSYSSDITLQPKVAKLVFSRRLDTRYLVTDVFPLEKTAAAIDLAAQPSAASLKVVVRQISETRSRQPSLAPQRGEAESVRAGKPTTGKP